MDILGQPLGDIIGWAVGGVIGLGMLFGGGLAKVADTRHERNVRKFYADGANSGTTYPGRQTTYPEQTAARRESKHLARQTNRITKRESRKDKS